MIKLTHDLSALTGISVLSLEKLSERISLIINHAIYEGMQERNNLIEINAEIGTLYIKLESNEVKYKFVPSLHFEESVKNTLKNKTDPLIGKLEDSLKNRIEQTYKELL